MHIWKRFFAGKSICIIAVLVAASFAALPSRAFAQAAQPPEKFLANASAGPDTASSNSSASTANANAELLKELEQMRRRIEQLEAQLKAQSGADQGAAPATAETMVSPSSGTSSSASAQDSQTTAAKQEPTKTEKQEPSAPFAYADWTWLNGNARNKDAVWDSKFFTPEIRFDANYI